MEVYKDVYCFILDSLEPAVKRTLWDRVFLDLPRADGL
jgi:hypothetical protein